tara:strand:+ start:35 stop:823 length:789 start_codon:yes stop_codon:yes gene_type:complete
MTPLPISATLITFNEEERIEYTLKSLKNLVKEIIVIDSGSTDQTVTLAEKYGAKVYFNQWKGYGPQKIFAESKTSEDWILNLDADESLSEALAQEIQQLFKENQPKYVAYQMDINLVFLWHKMPTDKIKEGTVVRLYNKKKAGFRASRVHDSVVLNNKDDKIGILKGVLYHRCFKSFSHWISKMNAYTTEQMQDWIERKRKEPSSLRIIFEPLLAFFKSLFVKRYLFLGIDGIIASYLYATAKLLRLIKVREAYRSKKMQKK